MTTSKEIRKYAEEMADFFSGEPTEDRVDSIHLYLLALIHKSNTEARIDELEKLQNSEHYPFYSDNAESYVDKRLAELSNTTEEAESKLGL